jgi:hypothetical protein
MGCNSIVPKTFIPKKKTSKMRGSFKDKPGTQSPLLTRTSTGLRDRSKIEVFFFFFFFFFFRSLVVLMFLVRTFFNGQITSCKKGAILF